MKIEVRNKSSIVVVLAASFAIFLSALLGRGIATIVHSSQRELSPEDAAKISIASTVLAVPTPDLSPSEVVTYQLNAIQKAKFSSSAFAECYAFATPSNRAFVGTIEQFEMVVRSNYSSLIGFQASLVGRESIEGNKAHVMVTGIDANDQFMCFQFFLVKQSTQPYAGCWMTEGVIRIDQPTIQKDSNDRRLNISINKFDNGKNRASMLRIANR